MKTNAQKQASRFMETLNQLFLALLDLLRSQHLNPGEELTSRCRTVALFVEELARTLKMNYRFAMTPVAFAEDPRNVDTYQPGKRKTP